MDKLIRMLWISPLAPYDAVKHAGGKTHNYYTKSFSEDNRFDITLVTWCSVDEKRIVEKEYNSIGIRTEIITYPVKSAEKAFWKMVNMESVLNPFNRYASYTKNSIAWRTIQRLKELKKRSFSPDVLFLHWTHINLLSDKIKALFPTAKIIEMEVDVAFQGYSRFYKRENRFLQKLLWRHKLKTLKKIELKNLRNADGIIVNNRKDEALLRNEGIDQPLFVWSPYFQSMLDVGRNYEKTNKDIIFYGAMDREENWKSALWFIKKVFPSLKGTGVRFVVVGNRPPEVLKNYESADIKILGFVEDISKIFSVSLCLVAPLILGAGIKVKVLEGLSSGIPVLTNQIGIEGIPAKRGKDYFYCETPEQYSEKIKELLNDEHLIHETELQEKAFIRNNYNIQEDAVRLHEFILDVVG